MRVKCSIAGYHHGIWGYWHEFIADLECLSRALSPLRDRDGGVQANSLHEDGMTARQLG